MKYHLDGSLPKNNEIFVFGSNLAGIHGAGAAKAAVSYYGALWGHGTGHHGQSYAIPTKDKSLMTLKLDLIKPYIEEFVQYTKDHPELEFFITRVGCGLAGYRGSSIAPLFKGIGPNCNIVECWLDDVI